MARRIRFVCCLLAVLVLMSGCMLKTVDQLYSLPKRSEEFNDLQSAITPAMSGLDYCAPLRGDNQQTVQLADLDGDGSQEALIFARGTDERPLKILIFARVDGVYTNTAVIETAGTAFEQVEYTNMDDKPGAELIVGRQLGNEVLHSLSVYSFGSGGSETILTAGYTRFLVADLNGNEQRELCVLRPGSDAGNGVAELYGWTEQGLTRIGEAAMSEPVDRMKRVAYGGMDDRCSAVFVASTYDENTIITDVFAVIAGRFVNVSLSNDSGTSIQTIRNYYVYADDIDKDGMLELPSPVHPEDGDAQEMLRWYNLMPDGSEREKVFTYHNYAERWYVRLQEAWMDTICVERGNEVDNVQGYIFRMGPKGPVLFTIYAFTGDDRELLAESEGRFLLSTTDEVAYSAELGSSAKMYELTQESLISDFNFIREAWKTGEM